MSVASLDPLPVDLSRLCILPKSSRLFRLAAMELDTLKSVDTAVSFSGRDLDNGNAIRRNRDAEKSDSLSSQDESVLARFGKKQQLKVCECIGDAARWH